MEMAVRSWALRSDYEILWTWFRVAGCLGIGGSWMRIARMQAARLQPQDVSYGQ